MFRKIITLCGVLTFLPLDLALSSTWESDAEEYIEKTRISELRATRQTPNEDLFNIDLGIGILEFIVNKSRQYSSDDLASSDVTPELLIDVADIIHRQPTEFKNRYEKFVKQEDDPRTSLPSLPFNFWRFDQIAETLYFRKHLFFTHKESGFIGILKNIISKDIPSLLRTLTFIRDLECIRTNYPLPYGIDKEENRTFAQYIDSLERTNKKLNSLEDINKKIKNASLERENRETSHSGKSEKIKEIEKIINELKTNIKEATDRLSRASIIEELKEKQRELVGLRKREETPLEKNDSASKKELEDELKNAPTAKLHSLLWLNKMGQDYLNLEALQDWILNIKSIPDFDNIDNREAFLAAIIQIGEHVGNLSSFIKDKSPWLPWEALRNLRNAIVHQEEKERWKFFNHLLSSESETYFEEWQKDFDVFLEEIAKIIYITYGRKAWVDYQKEISTLFLVEDEDREQLRKFVFEKWLRNHLGGKVKAPPRVLRILHPKFWGMDPLNLVFSFEDTDDKFLGYMYSNHPDATAALEGKKIHPYDARLFGLDFLFENDIHKKLDFPSYNPSESWKDTKRGALQRAILAGFKNTLIYKHTDEFQEFKEHLDSDKKTRGSDKELPPHLLNMVKNKRKILIEGKKPGNGQTLEICREIERYIKWRQANEKMRFTRDVIALNFQSSEKEKKDLPHQEKKAFAEEMIKKSEELSYSINQEGLQERIQAYNFSKSRTQSIVEDELMGTGSIQATKDTINSQLRTIYKKHTNRNPSAPSSDPVSSVTSQIDHLRAVKSMAFSPQSYYLTVGLSAFKEWLTNEPNPDEPSRQFFEDESVRRSRNYLGHGNKLWTLPENLPTISRGAPYIAP